MRGKVIKGTCDVYVVIPSILRENAVPTTVPTARQRKRTQTVAFPNRVLVPKYRFGVRCDQPAHNFRILIVSLLVQDSLN